MSLKRYAGDRFVGNSATIKPTNVDDGALFFEEDTLLHYVLKNGQWVVTKSDETDPVFSASPASSITNANIVSWNTSFDRSLTGVTGSGDGTLTLTKEDGTTLTANLAHGHIEYALTGHVHETLVNGTGLVGNNYNGSAATTWSVAYGTTSTTAARGDDARLSDSREWTASTVTQAEAEAGTATTRRAWTAQRVKQAINSHERFLSTVDSTDLSSVQFTVNNSGTFSVDFTPSVEDIAATGRTNSTYLRGDGTWATPTNTTYSLISEASILGGTETTSRSISAARIKYAFDNLKAASSAVADSANAVTWGNVSSKPLTATRWPAWGEVTSKPVSFPPAEHDASLITSGTISIDRLPAAALDRLIIVANQTERYALTVTTVQNGDTVQQADTGIMYRVVDDTNLGNASGYVEYTAARASAVPWSGVESKPATATRWPTWTEVSSKPSTFTPSAHDHAWSEINGKPSTFPPSSHTHLWSHITDSPDTANRWPSWGEVTSKPSTFAPSAHTHLWAHITDKPSTFPPSSHSHSWGSITGKPTTFAPSSHTHGAITNSGAIASDTAVSIGHKLIIADGNGVLRRSPLAFGSNTGLFLRNDGTWGNPAAGTTYHAGNGIHLSGTTFSVIEGDGLDQTASGLAVNSTVIRTTGAQTMTGTKTFSAGARFGNFQIRHNATTDSLDFNYIG